MKKLLFVFLSSFLLLSCLPSVKMQPSFYKSHTKVGVIVIKDSISIWKNGAQGLLDMAISSGRKYRGALQSVNPKINVTENIYQAASKTFKQIKKNYSIIDDQYQMNDFGNFKTVIVDKENNQKRYLKTDLTHFKNKYGIDHLLVVFARYGLSIDYYGMIELQKNGMCSLITLIVNLSDNSVIFLNNTNAHEVLRKKWNTPPDYDNLTNTIQKAVDKAVTQWNAKL